MENKEELESLQNYLGLETVEEARKAKWILDELEVYGEWGDKISTYFIALLSGNKGTRSFIPENQIEAYKSLFDIKIPEDNSTPENNN